MHAPLSRALPVDAPLEPTAALQLSVLLKSAAVALVVLCGGLPRDERR